jgi:hypothetical protein
VFGSERELRGILHQRGAQALLVATDAIPLERLQRAADTCKQAGARMFRLNVRVEQFDETITLDVPPLQEAAGSADLAIGQPAPTGATANPVDPMGSDPCPSCRGEQLRRSKARRFDERLRKSYTLKRIFRCQECGWRGWLVPLERPAMVEVTWSPDLTAIDSSMGLDHMHRAN